MTYPQGAKLIKIGGLKTNFNEKRCKCGSVQFKYNGDCLSCGLSEEERNLMTSFNKELKEFRQRFYDDAEGIKFLRQTISILLDELKGEMKKQPEVNEGNREQVYKACKIDGWNAREEVLRNKIEEIKKGLN